MKRIIIDCDPGTDDVQAIMMAYRHPEVRIEAITTVSGNVGLDLNLPTLDWYGLLGRSPNLNIVRKVDIHRFFQLFKLAFE